MHGKQAPKISITTWNAKSDGEKRYRTSSRGKREKQILVPKFKCSPPSTSVALFIDRKIRHFSFFTTRLWSSTQLFVNRFLHYRTPYPFGGLRFFDLILHCKQTIQDYKWGSQSNPYARRINQIKNWYQKVQPASSIFWLLFTCFPRKFFQIKIQQAK